jgi:hypothetical protein
MQYKKLTKEQKQIRAQRMTYAKKIGKLMAEHPTMTAREARDYLKKNK